MNKLLTFVIGLVVSSSYAQQVPLYNHYLINPFVYNPALTGNSEYINTAFVRNQRFSSFGSMAVNNYLTVEGAFNKDKMGLGIMVAHQTQGVQQQLMSTLNYAYRLKINEDHTIRFGFAAGVLDNRIDYSELNAEDVNDPYLMALRPTKPVFNLNVGLNYQWKNLQIGVAIPQIIGNKVEYANTSDRGYFQLERHYMGSVQYNWIIKDKWRIQPNALVRFMPNAPLQYDGGVQAWFNNKIWLGATYKSDYAVQFNAGVHLFDFVRVGYSYEYLIGKMRDYQTGVNHEVFVGFSFKSKKEKEIQIVEKEVKVPDDIAARERDSVQRLKDELENQLREILAEKDALKRKQDSLDMAAKNTTKPVATNPEEIPYAKGYKFVELDSTDSPDGFYIISGVYASKKNAESVLNSLKSRYSTAYLVVNLTNKYYYVVILHTLDQLEAMKTFTEYKKLSKSKVWILNYKKDI